MDGPLMMEVYRWVRELRPRRRARERWADAWIVALACWAAMNNRGQGWACEAPLPEGVEPWPRPSAAQMSRRLRRDETAQLLMEVQKKLRDKLGVRGPVKVIDAKPLPVGGASKDRLAQFGHAAGGMARGYKLYALIDAHSGAIDDWLVAPMGFAESAAARQLIERMSPAAYLVGDNAYDLNALYDLAASRGIRLLAPPKPSAKSLGHRRHSPHRLEAHALLKGPRGPLFKKLRLRIERLFAHLTTGPARLTLPFFVRSIRRVGRFLALKFIAHAANQLRKQRT
jgi:hypothetical protein